MTLKIYSVPQKSLQAFTCKNYQSTSSQLPHEKYRVKDEEHAGTTLNDIPLIEENKEANDGN